MSVLEAVLTARTAADLDRHARAGSGSTDPLNEALRIAAHGEPLILVLDECEHLGAATMAATIGRVSRDAPSLLSVVIITNHDLDLPARFRNGARMRVLRAADLAFTVSEVQELFAQEQLMLCRDEATTLAGWTEGTLEARAKLIAENIGRVARGEPRQAGDDTSALVTAAPSDARPAQLIATAIVDPVSADLAAITGTDDAAEHLADLARDDVFLEPVDGCPGWYAPASDASCCAELAHRRPDDVVPLHRRAARWFDDARCPAKPWTTRSAAATGRSSSASCERTGSPRRSTSSTRTRRRTRTDERRCGGRHRSCARGEHHRSRARRRACRRRSWTFSQRRPRPCVPPTPSSSRGSCGCVWRGGRRLGRHRRGRRQPEPLVLEPSGIGRFVSDVSALADGPTPKPARRRRSRQGDRALERVVDEATADEAIARSPTRPPPAVITALSGRAWRATALVDELGETWILRSSFAWRARVPRDLRVPRRRAPSAQHLATEAPLAAARLVPRNDPPDRSCAHRGEHW
jgi:hypothetical protein